MTPQPTETITARVEYGKTGRLRFLGHLDTARLITRAVRASGWPARTTQGCSPHLDLSFGPALPLGTSADGEFFDVRLSEPVDPATACEALQARMPNGFDVRSVRLIMGKVEPLVVFLDRADYVVDVPETADLDPEAIARFLARDEVIVVRTRGTRTKPVNVRRFVERLEQTRTSNGIRLEMTLSMTAEGSTNPREVLGALDDAEVLDTAALRIHRTRTYHASDTRT